MKFAHKIAHLVFPRESNNQKAKLLHSSSLTLITIAFVFYQIILTLVPKLGSKILGYAANISPQDVIRLTNEKRVQEGLLPLVENTTLSQAALAKGNDMLGKGYWAHVAPDGTQPWKFFTDFGYKYRYAGENLARDFSNPSSAVDAWMASPTHKENLLSPKYKEVGIAVVEGNLAGVDTTIIVQFFGTKYVDTIPAVPVAEAKSQATPSAGTALLTEKTVIPSSPIPTLQPSPIIVSNKPTSGLGRVLVSPFDITKNTSLGLVGVLLGILAVDGVVVSKRKITRVGGRTFAHLAFLGMIISIILLLKAGQVI